MRGAHMAGWTALRDEGRVELAAACDTRKETAAAFAKDFGIAKVFTDFNEMFAKVDLDVVDVATPNMGRAISPLRDTRRGKTT